MQMYDYPLTAEISVSFQRYPFPAGGFVTELPSSWGALPFLQTAQQQLVLPCPTGEAFWIGLVTSPPGRHQVRVLVSTTTGVRVDALAGKATGDTAPSGTDGFHAPPRHGVPGILRGTRSWWAFARDTARTSGPACRDIEISSASGETPIRANSIASVRVRMVEPGRFETLGGIRVPPLDERDRYGGWRLP